MVLVLTVSTREVLLRMERIITDSPQGPLQSVQQTTAGPWTLASDQAKLIKEKLLLGKHERIIEKGSLSKNRDLQRVSYLLHQQHQKDNTLTQSYTCTCAYLKHGSSAVLWCNDEVNVPLFSQKWRVGCVYHQPSVYQVESFMGLEAGWHHWICSSDSTKPQQSLFWLINNNNNFLHYCISNTMFLYETMCMIKKVLFTHLVDVDLSFWGVFVSKLWNNSF